jgi:NAD(P)-dependent dehydrogenase (short-subunit alcohol dehydrogenase family)
VTLSAEERRRRRVSGRVQNKSAVITGAGSGIGVAAALLFAREGARVVVSDVDGAAAEATARRIEEEGGEAIHVPCDVSQEDQVENLIRAGVESFGALDVLYNNAGTEAGDGHVTALTGEAWDRVQNVNLKGTFLICKYGIPRLVASGGGSIINTSSVAALHGGGAPDSYTAAKGGILALTRVLAVRYARQGVRINAICPGPVMTPMIERLGPRFVANSVAATPLGRGAEPEEIANLALFLASDESSFITAAIIPIDGGLTAR